MTPLILEKKDDDPHALRRLRTPVLAAETRTSSERKRYTSDSVPEQIVDCAVVHLLRATRSSSRTKTCGGLGGASDRLRLIPRGSTNPATH